MIRVSELKPDTVTFNFKEEDLKELLLSVIARESGIELDEDTVYFSVDEETGFVRFVVEEELVTEEQVDALYSAGFNIQEWYEMTNGLYRTLFKTENVCSYISLDEYEAMNENDELIVPVTLRYSAWLDWEKFTKDYVEFKKKLTSDEKMAMICLFKTKIEEDLAKPQEKNAEFWRVADAIMEDKLPRYIPGLLGYKNALISKFPNQYHELKTIEDPWSK